MSTARVTAAIVGPGNIGTDLLAKLQRSSEIDVRYMVGVVESDGLTRAREQGLAVSAEGVDWLLRQDPLPQIVFGTTSAKAHRPTRRATRRPASSRRPDAAHSDRWCARGERAAQPGAPNVSMITCGGQATIPMVHAVSGDGGAVRGDRRVGGLAQRRTRTRATSTSSPTPPRRRWRGRGSPSAQGDHHPEPGGTAMIMRDTVFC